MGNITWLLLVFFAVCASQALGSANVKKQKAWMSKLDGELYLSQLSIPGTHDSCATSKYTGKCGKKAPSYGLCETQYNTLVEQLDVGIRFFDIRLKHKNNDFDIHHGIVYLKRNIDQVMTDFRQFLQQNPDETIIMSYQKEGGEEDCDRSFHETLETKINRDATIIYRGNSVPQLKDVRGKIVLLNFANDGRSDQGLMQDEAFSSSSVANDYQPECCCKNCEEYIESLEKNMDNANRANSTKTLYITYTSATGKLKFLLWKTKTPWKYANLVNPIMKNFLESRPEQYIAGCVVMDFPSDELIQTIIRKNTIPVSSRNTGE